MTQSGKRCTDQDSRTAVCRSTGYVSSVDKVCGNFFFSRWKYIAHLIESSPPFLTRAVAGLTLDVVSIWSSIYVKDSSSSAHYFKNLVVVLDLVTSAHIQDRVRKPLRTGNMVKGDENVEWRSFYVGISLALACLSPPTRAWTNFHLLRFRSWLLFLVDETSLRDATEGQACMVRTMRN